jgi:hypothetical protein
MRDSLDHLAKIGWAHDDADQAHIDKLYERWLDQTREEWKLTGIRDREPLREAVGNYLQKRHGEETGQALWIVWVFQLELRARRNGHTRRTPAV